MTTTESTVRPKVQAPRYHEGKGLGMCDAEVVRPPIGSERSDRAFVVRFEDGHEASVLRSDLLATAHNWSQLDAMEAVGF